MDKFKPKFDFWGKVKNNIALILAFLVPAIIMICIFIGSDVFPFGDSIYLRSDCYHQYAPFYRELYRKITEGGSFAFSWNIGMGVNFSAIYSYYLASPINLLLGILAPGGNVLITIDALIILKTGLCGFAVAYYLSKRHNTKSLTLALAGLFYAMSSYMVAFSWNIMWLDCLVLLPFIVLGIERLVNEKKFLTYAISLGIAIFSNYYIAIMICIFSVLYFAVILFTSKCQKNLKYFAGRIWLFAKYSLIAGGIGAATIFPALYALSYTASGEMSFPELWTNYFSILDMLSRSIMNVPVSIFNAHEPNLYCTMAVFMLIPLYCLCDKVNRSEKIGKLIIIGILLFSFNTNIPNYIWHGFHFPNSLPARESFIYIFLLVVMGYEAAIQIKNFTTKQIGGAFAGGLVLLMFIEKTYVNGSDYTFQMVYTSALFLIVYFLIALAYKNKRISRNVIVYILFIVCISEATINGTQEEAFKVTGYSYYFQDNEAITGMLDKIDDKDFYRVEKLQRKTKNDAAWNDYNGVSIFSSTASAYFTDYLGALGFEKSTNAYSYYGYTPFTSALLSVRYVIADNAFEGEKEYLTLVDSEPVESRYLYELNYNLPLGFMIPSYFDTLWEKDGNNPFAVQNSFAATATGILDMFTQLDATSMDKSTFIDVKEDCDLYIYCTSYVESISYTAQNEDTGFSLTGDATGLKHRQIVHIGQVEAGSTVTVSTTEADVASLQLYAYELNMDKFNQVMDALSDEGLEVTDFEDTYIKGTINAKTSGVMYTSIIYDKGWSAYVDGEKVELGSVDGAVITIPVSEGTHTIEFKYTPEGFIKGWFITIGSIIVLICCILYDRNRRMLLKIKKANDEEEIIDDTIDEKQVDKVKKIEEKDHAGEKDHAQGKDSVEETDNGDDLSEEPIEDK